MHWTPFWRLKGRTKTPFLAKPHFLETTLPTNEQICKLIIPALRDVTVDPNVTVSFKDNEFHATIHGVTFIAGTSLTHLSFYRYNETDEHEIIEDCIQITLPPWNVGEKEWETGEWIYPV
jgi:hypothetical protein